MHEQTNQAATTPQAPAPNPILKFFAHEHLPPQL